MTTNSSTGLSASLSAAAIALLLHQPLLAEDKPAAATATPATPAATSKAQPAKAPAAAAQTPAQPAKDATPAAEPSTQAAVAASEERRAAKMAELNKRYQALRSEAAQQGFEMPAAPPWRARPHWMSYEEMRELMQARGVPMPPDPLAKTPSRPKPPGGAKSPEQLTQLFDTFEQMTPEQQEACFAISRWQTPRMPRWMGPAFSRHPMPQRPHACAPRQGQPHPGMMYPQ